MKKVTNVNLNGRAYQIEEDGYQALKKYLDSAAQQLANNPDSDEIIADFEQAIAEKCDQVLAKDKTVVSEAEIRNIFAEMGPVSLDDENQKGHESSKPKRFYLIKEGSIVGGVCNGLAAYFNVDVTVVRLVAVLTTLFTSGAVVLAYIAVMFVAPEAVTPEEKASARGKSFNSKELLETARQKYAVLGDKEHWKQVASENQPIFSKLGTTIRKVLRIISGLVALFGLFALLGLLVAGITGVWSLIISGQFFGLTIDSSISSSLLSLFVGSGLIVGAVPVFIVTVAAYKYAKSGSLRQNVWGVVSALSIFAVALGVCLAILSTTPGLRTVSDHYTDNPDVNNHIICVGVCKDGQ